jgi:hypothetical protein
LYVPYANPPPASTAMARTAKIRLRIGSSQKLTAIAIELVSHPALC